MFMLASIQAAMRLNQPFTGDGQGLDGGEGGSEAAGGYDGSDGAEGDEKQHGYAGAGDAEGGGYEEPAAKRVKVERE
jgi:hypothetical protein